MNINSDFDLKKAKNFLLTENFDASYLQEDDLEENEMLDEMASFYKVTDDSPEAKEAIAAKKAKFRPGSAMYNTLDALEKEGEADYKEFKKATISPENPQGKDIATWNNPKSREVLETDLAQYIAASSSPTAVRTGRPADPNKPAAEPKEPKAAKTPGEQKIKITPSKAKSEPSADDKIDTKVEKDSRSKDEMIKALRALKDERLEVNKAFKGGDKTAISKLKDLTTQINKLSKKLGV
jgi:hypothetical protein